MKGLMFAVFCGVLLMPWPTWAVSKRPPETPVTINSGRPIADLRPLLADTNNLEITHVFLCRLGAQRCDETIWDIALPAGWQQPDLTLFGNYPGATVRVLRHEALQPGGSYNLFIHFNERSRLHQQTVDNTVTEFCLEEKSDALRVLTRADCRARRIAAQHQGGPAQ
ncbi:hypothetical protein L2088_30210 [Pseudomonas protegens]|uniref:hypothetical protein n=1 Tax=Pseudomonas protegens TaxID=380021 RepID=UPI0020254E8E|nr:hypothetical protein [Pseudomonas protegens]MCL9658978.1 hypothetical protein [Pseudomonas protegens]